MEVLIVTGHLSIAEEQRLFDFIHERAGMIVKGKYDSKCTFYKVRFYDPFSKKIFCAAFEEYKFKRQRSS